MAVMFSVVIIVILQVQASLMILIIMSRAGLFKFSDWFATQRKTQQYYTNIQREKGEHVMTVDIESNSDSEVYERCINS